MATELQNLSNKLAETVEHAAASIVAVHARRGVGSSGIAWRDNLILTTSEGVRAEEGIKVVLPDGRVTTARLRGRDSGTDLAVLEIERRPSTARFRRRCRAQSRTTGPGSGTHGQHRTDRVLRNHQRRFAEWKTWRGGKLDPFVRLDISAYPTLSGGAALSADGKLIGLVSTGLSRSSVFAVTGRTIGRIAGKLSQQGFVSRGFLGIALQPVALPPQMKETLGQEAGIMLVGIEPEGPASVGGLILGDVLVTSTQSPGAMLSRSRSRRRWRSFWNGRRRVRLSNSRCCARAYCRMWTCVSESGLAAGNNHMGAAFGEIVEKLRRWTVQVKAHRNGGGSGVIWSPDGRIVTNAHVVDGAGRSIEVELWDGRRFPGQIVKQDRRRDLAAIQIEASGLPAVTTGDSNALRVGELVIAVGNPWGFIGAASTGVVHGFESQSWVVSRLRLAPGNSGGPLANAHGEVVGINTMIAAGLAFAIPSNSVARFLRAGNAGRATDGVVVRPIVGGTHRSRSDSELASGPRVAAPGRHFSGRGREAIPVDRRTLGCAIHASRGGILELQFRRGGSANIRTVAAQMALCFRESRVIRVLVASRSSRGGARHPIQLIDRICRSGRPIASLPSQLSSELSGDVLLIEVEDPRRTRLACPGRVADPDTSIN